MCVCVCARACLYARLVSGVRPRHLRHEAAAAELVCVTMCRKWQAMTSVAPLERCTHVWRCDLEIRVGAQSIVYHKNINIANAVATEGGLITPVLKNANVKDILTISAEVTVHLNARNAIQRTVIMCVCARVRVCRAGF